MLISSLCKLSFITCIALFLTGNISCNRLNNEEPPCTNCFVYKQEYLALYLGDCDIEKLPDSIASKDITQLVINSTKPIDFEILSKHIDLKGITTIRYDDLDHPEINLNFAKFEKLRALGIFGRVRVKKINLYNLSDSLRSLRLYGPNLIFPQFDSTFLNLNELSYGGISDVIPQWIENLTQLEDFTFKSKYLSTIECDICKMNKIFEFNIVDPNVKNKELYLSKMKIYPTIQKIKKCKPELRFWNVLPPA